VLEPFGLRWLPATRVVDGAWIAVVLAAALGWSGGRGVPTTKAPEDGVQSSTRFPRRELVTGLAGVLLALVTAWPGQRALTLWPRAAEWPTLGSIERGLRLPDLWAVLREAPAGRVLFVRSAMPLVYGVGSREWHRPHTHVTALAPLFSSRAIVNGTFTHPSPIAALTYRGDAGPGPITRLVEQLDGVSLFGRPLDALDPEAFARYADTLGVSVVVAIDEDAAHLSFVERSREFVRRESPGPFLIYQRRDAVALPRAAGPGRFTITLAGGPDGWVSTRTAYYPLWRARADGAPIESRRGRDGDLEVKLEPGGGARAVELDYRPGAPEIGGLVVSAGGVVGLVAFRRRARIT